MTMRFPCRILDQPRPSCEIAFQCTQKSFSTEGVVLPTQAATTKSEAAVQQPGPVPAPAEIPLAPESGADGAGQFLPALRWVWG